MEKINRKPTNLFAFLPLDSVIKNVETKKKKEIKLAFENYSISEDLLDVVLENSISKVWRQEVISSCKPFFDDTLVKNINLYRNGKLITIEVDEDYIEKVKRIANCICSNIDDMMLSDYLKLREFLGKLSLDNLSILEESIVLGIKLMCSNKNKILEILKVLEKQKDIEWYPFSKLEWRDVSLIEHINGVDKVVNKRQCERLYEEVKVIDFFFVCYEVLENVEKIIQRYVYSFVEKEKMLSIDEMLDKVENDGIDDLFCFIENYFLSFSFCPIFRSIYDGLMEESYFIGELRSQVEIKFIKKLKSVNNLNLSKKASQQPIIIYKNEEARKELKKAAISKKNGRSKSRSKEISDFYKKFHKK